MALQGGCGLKPHSAISVLMERCCLLSSAESLSLPARVVVCSPLVCRAAARSKGTPAGKDRIASGPASLKKQGFSAGSPKPKKKVTDEEDAAADAALEALFQQLEKDLEEDDDDDEDEELTPEELEELERELGEALADIDDLDEELGIVNVVPEGIIDIPDGDEGIDKKKQSNRKKSKKSGEPQTAEASAEVETGLDNDAGDKGKDAEEAEIDEIAELLEKAQEPRIVNLELWQLKKLAAASELGRRNINIKALAAETRLDRGDVLAWIKSPSPELLAELAMEPDDEDTMEDNMEARNSSGNAPSTSGMSKKSLGSTQRQKADKPKSEPAAPGTPRDWHNQKRLSKVELATFERVYQRSTHPTNAMIDNLVQLTHVPRKRIIRWFDNRRVESDKDPQSFDPVPEQRK